MDGGLGVAPEYSRTAAAARTSGLCVFHTETLCVCHRECVVSIQQIYSVYTADIQVAECQIWPKMMKSGPNQVHMAWFGLIFNQNRFHGV